MSCLPPSESERRKRRFLEKLSSDERRKIRSQNDRSGGIWSGLTFFGYVGWTVSVPTLLGAALGVWLDRRHPTDHSWTLALLVAGLTFGCFNAWRWLSEEDARINALTENSSEETSRAP